MAYAEAKYPADKDSLTAPQRVKNKDRSHISTRGGHTVVLNQKNPPQRSARNLARPSARYSSSATDQTPHIPLAISPFSGQTIISPDFEKILDTPCSTSTLLISNKHLLP